jgi:O-antigen/teichoic acid export membrane protein
MAGRYQKLMSNTLVFAAGSFSSKLLVFLMMRYYTGALTPAQFGIADRIIATSNLLMPFVMLSINEAILRFGMDNTARKADVFTIGLKTVMAGFIVFCTLCPAVLLFDMIAPYTLLLYFYVLLGMLKSVTAQFVRSMGLVRLYAFDGLVSTLTTIGFNVLFLTGFRWGISGFVLSVVASNALSVLFLFVVARLWRFVRLGGSNPRLRREMLRYSMPLIPTTMFWWIINVSDRYMVALFCGDTASGLYAVAYKIPSLMTIVSAIFYQAWQISAVSESGQGRQTTQFYSRIYDSFSTLLFLAASGVVMLIRPITAILYAPAYHSSWEFVPFLVIAEVFSSLVTFLGSFYMVSKRNLTVPLAIFVGAAANILLNLRLIPLYGPQGAAFATLVSYLLAFGVRAVDVRRLVEIDLRALPTACCLLLLMIQSALLLKGASHPALAQFGMFTAMAIFNLRPLLRLSFGLFDRLFVRTRR